MQNTIIQDAAETIGEDTKFIRLATITTFVHSVVFVIVILFNVYTFVSNTGGTDSWIIHLLQRYVAIILPEFPPVWIILLLLVVLFFGYVILPPIGESAMISYLDREQKSGTASFTTGLNKFFMMFEFDASVSLFGLFFFFVAVSRFYLLDIWDQPLIIMVSLIWWFMILMVSLLLPYARYEIVLRDKAFIDAMKASISLSIDNIGITIRYALITYFLYVRLLINAIIVVGVPMWLIYLSTILGVDRIPWIETLILCVIIGLIFLTAYLNGIVEAFFTSYRHRVYKSIQK